MANDGRADDDAVTSRRIACKRGKEESCIAGGVKTRVRGRCERRQGGNREFCRARSCAGSIVPQRRWRGAGPMWLLSWELLSLPLTMMVLRGCDF